MLYRRLGPPASTTLLRRRLQPSNEDAGSWKQQHLLLVYSAVPLNVDHRESNVLDMDMYMFIEREEEDDDEEDDTEMPHVTRCLRLRLLRTLCPAGGSPKHRTHSRRQQAWLALAAYLQVLRTPCPAGG